VSSISKNGSHWKPSIDAITIPHVGGGLLFRLGRLFYFDFGATLDTVGVPWLSIGVLIFF